MGECSANGVSAGPRPRWSLQRVALGAERLHREGRREDVDLVALLALLGDPALPVVPVRFLDCAFLPGSSLPADTGVVAAPFFDGAFVDVAFLVADVRFLGAFLVEAAAFVPGREGFRPERPSTVSVPGAGTTEVSSADDQRTRSIEPVTPVTIPSRSVPLLSLRRIRSPTFAMKDALPGHRRARRL
jgi:hypothetical protein